MSAIQRNNNRAKRGMRSLMPYRPNTEGYQTALIDLLADIMHATSQIKLGPDDVVHLESAVKIARQHYFAELREALLPETQS